MPPGTAEEESSPHFGACAAKAIAPRTRQGAMGVWGGVPRRIRAGRAGRSLGFFREPRRSPTDALCDRELYEPKKPVDERRLPERRGREGGRKIQGCPTCGPQLCGFFKRSPRTIRSASRKVINGLVIVRTLPLL